MSGDVEALKREAASRAAEYVRDGMVVGLGTGSTVAHFLDIVGERIRSGELEGVSGIPTSERTAARARTVQIPLTSFEDEPALDLVVDGADEVDPDLNLVKGGGGALLREKIVATAGARVVIIADEGKLVSRLGSRSPLPVEVVPFGWSLHLSFLDSLGAQPILRCSTEGEPVRTDGGNYILDCAFSDGIADPIRIDGSIRERVGVIETGLFLGLADEVIVGGSDGVRTLESAGGVA